MQKSMGWRTMLIVPELQMELQKSQECEATQRELALLRKVRDETDERIHRLEWELTHTCALFRMRFSHVLGSPALPLGQACTVLIDRNQRCFVVCSKQDGDIVLHAVGRRIADQG
jgi:5' nucleotidase family